MNELIRIDYENENPTVSGRELHCVCQLKSVANAHQKV